MNIIDNISKNKMRILVIIGDKSAYAINASDIQKILKPRVKGSIPAYAGVLLNLKHLIKLGLAERLFDKTYILTYNGKYYAELMGKLYAKQRKKKNVPELQTLQA